MFLGLLVEHRVNRRYLGSMCEQNLLGCRPRTGDPLLWAQGQDLEETTRQMNRPKD